MVDRSNPVHQYDGKWWFWDEIWVHRIGPYDSAQEVADALKKYCIEKLGYSENDFRRNSQ